MAASSPASCSQAVATTPLSGPRARRGNVLSWITWHEPTKFNDAVIDGRNASHFKGVQNLMEHCAEHPEDIEIMNSYAATLKDSHSKAEKANKGHPVMAISTLGQMDEATCIETVVELGDFDDDDIYKAIGYDPQAPWHLLAHALAGSLHWKLDQRLQDVVLFKRWAKERHVEVGSPLAKWKELQGFLPSGKLSWKNKVYRMAYDDSAEHKLTMLTHLKSGVTADLPAKCTITKGHDFQNSWSDTDAIARIPPMRGDALITFFAKKLKADKNTFTYPIGNNERRYLQQHDILLTKVAKTLADERSATSSGTSAASTDKIKKTLEEIKRKSAADNFAKGREKNLETVSKKLLKRKLSDP